MRRYRIALWPLLGAQVAPYFKALGYETSYALHTVYIRVPDSLNALDVLQLCRQCPTVQPDRWDPRDIREGPKLGRPIP